MGHYRSNVRDLEFNLFEVLDLEKALATGEFGDLDGESVRQMLDEAARQAEGPLAEPFADADRNPPTFDPETHTVTLPESFHHPDVRRALLTQKAYAEGLRALYLYTA